MYIYIHECKSSKVSNSDLTKIDYKHKKEFMGICTVMDMSPTPINVFKNMPCKNTMNDSPINATISKNIWLHKFHNSQFDRCKERK